MSKHILLIIILVFPYSFSVSGQGLNAKWEKVKGGKGVVVFAADVPGKDVVAFRGETVIEAPIKRLVAALHDMKRKPEWMHELHTVRIVRKIGQNERIEHYHSKTPWPLDDRDFVTPDDIQAVFPSVAEHRLGITTSTDNILSNALIENINIAR